MIKIQDIKKIVKLTLLSGYIKNIQPLSLLLIGCVGIGKTSIIQSFESNDYHDYLTDVCSSGFIGLLTEKDKIKHIIIPDLIKITMKKMSTSQHLISTLNSAVEEGLFKIRSYHTVDLKGKKIGIVTSITKTNFNKNRSMWVGMGFVSRMIICSYSYSDLTLSAIMEYTNEEQFTKEIQEKLEIDTTKDIIIKSSKDLNSLLNPFVAKSVRTLKQLQGLAKCNALNEGRTKVKKEDITEVIRLIKFLNLDYNEI